MVPTDKNNEIVFTTFDVGDFMCAIDNTYVQEIYREIRITTVFGAPEYIRGVINVRGQIVTIIDMKRKLGLEDSIFTKNTRIIILNTDNELIGLLVDNIRDTFTGDKNKIDLPPSNIDKKSRHFFSGVYKTEDGLLGIIEKDKVLEM